MIARFDFSKADDSVYLQKPQWFVRNPDGTPHAYGIGRTGPWSILYSTCINGGYRNYEVAVPVLKEALKRYEFDGVFLNAPNYEPAFASLAGRNTDRCSVKNCQWNGKTERTSLHLLPLPIEKGLKGEGGMGVTVL